MKIENIIGTGEKKKEIKKVMKKHPDRKGNRKKCVTDEDSACLPDAQDLNRRTPLFLIHRVSTFLGKMDFLKKSKTTKLVVV
jgi:hypothetical protein